LKKHTSSILSLVSHCEFSEVTVIVTLHLVVEDLGLTGLCCWDKVIVEDHQDVCTNVTKFSLDFHTVILIISSLHTYLDIIRMGMRYLDLLDLTLVSLVLLFLLDRGDDSPTRTPGTNDILVRDGEQVTLFYRKFNAELDVSKEVKQYLCNFL
jgi:hypothetical protein